MFLTRRRGGEGLVAMLALKGTLVGVGPLVDHFTAASSVGLATEPTSVRSGVRVKDSVAPHLVIRVVLGLADVARERFVTAVSLQVQFEVGRGLEDAAALVTEPGLGVALRTLGDTGTYSLRDDGHVMELLLTVLHLLCLYLYLFLLILLILSRIFCVLRLLIIIVIFPQKPSCICHCYTHFLIRVVPQILL